MMRWAFGFDLSLAAPACVALPLDWRPGDWKRVHSFLIKPEAPESIEDLSGRMDRYETISKWAQECILKVHCGSGGAIRTGPQLKALLQSCYYVENYGYRKNNAGSSLIMESGGITKIDLYRRFRVILRPLPASTARSLLLGKLPREKGIKAIVQDALFNKAGAPKQWDENQADAFVIANWALSEMGGTVLTLAQAPPRNVVKKRRSGR